VSPHQAISLDFKPVQKPVQADFTFSITPDTISITDTNLGRRAVTNDIEAVLRTIEYWHQGSIVAFKIMYRDDTEFGMVSAGMDSIRRSLPNGRRMREGDGEAVSDVA
jgi:hypothetical protein